MSSISHKLVTAFTLSCLLFLTGCKTNLYAGLEERQANEMVAILLENGIEVDKIVEKKGLVALQVDSSKMQRAIQLLNQLGYPKDDYANMGDVFQKSGLISSPLEERARYIYAISQELGDTLSRLDGVLDAKVHVVMPEMSSSGEELTPSSAAVFIRHKADINLEPFIPKIKLLVNNSIDDLDYEKITVALFPSIQIQSEEDRWRSILGIQVTKDSAVMLYIIFGLLFLIILAIAGSLGFMVWRQRQHGRAVL
ncbi:MAG: type III secretion inner membrane ring lipoprotein SctJ [Pseudomonadota bacterium]